MVARTLPGLLGSVLHALTCTLYPASCSLCARSLLRFSRVPVCEVCWSRLLPQSTTLCLRCGEDLGIPHFSPGSEADAGTRGPRDQLCQPCRLAPPPFVRAVAFGVYEGELRGLIHLLKYKGMRSIAEGLGEHLGHALLVIPELPSDLVAVPVPLHRSKHRARGFNHAELIAQSLATVMRGPESGRRVLVAPRALQRTRATESQSNLSPRGRRRNLRGAFTVGEPERIAGQYILLVDDIYTTGATARAAAGVLMRAGAASVWVATAARAQREGVALWDADAGLGRQAVPAGANPASRETIRPGRFQIEES